MSAKQHARPIVVVTGANGGVGFAVCHRLLVQLARRLPPDALPQRAVSREVCIDEDANIDLEELADCDGLTLILACRDVTKAEAARTELFRLLDEEVTRQKLQKNYDGHAGRFRENVVVVVHRLDLASVESVFNFGREINSKYPYVSHFVCNAGVASFTGYNWVLCTKQLLTEFITAVTSPVYKLQKVGEISEDGLGWVWQCNVFGHYVLYRLLEPLMARYYALSSEPSRMIWMTSVEAYPSSYDPEDWQLIKSTRAYEASKYQMDLLVGYFEQQQHRALAAGSSLPVRHFLSHPGVVRTNIALKSLNSVFLDYLMQLTFFIAHFLGSPAHVITPYKSAISAVHLMLVALPFISVAAPRDSQKPPAPFKFGSQVDYWFNEYVAVSTIKEWDERSEQAVQLAEHCETLFQTFNKKGGSLT
ncbi:hypothetical protein M0805_000795 [Coniferiporia weirii]|nr:hypothetical protein M0805_000795 [Coniferiporia weirii]